MVVFSCTHTIMSGYHTETVALVKRYNADMFILSKGAHTPFHSQISYDDFRHILEMDGVKEGFPLLSGTIDTALHPYFPLIGVVSTTHLYGLIWMFEGRLFSPDEKELVLGRLAARRRGLRVGDHMTLSEGEEFRIVGIFSSGHTVVDGSAILGIEPVRRIFHWEKTDFVSCAIIRVMPGRDPAVVSQAIYQKFPHLNAVRSIDLIEKNKVIGIAESMIAVLSIFTLGACCLLTMNTILMAVTERMKEIGLFMAIGWSRARVVRMIIMEAVLLSLIGTVLGNAVGFLLLAQMHRLTKSGLSWIPGALSWESVIISAGLAIIMGVLGALYPAWVATRLKPAEALRYE